MHQSMAVMLPGSGAQHLLGRADMPPCRFLGRSDGGGSPEAGLSRCQQRLAQQRGLAVRLDDSAKTSDTSSRR